MSIAVEPFSSTGRFLIYRPDPPRDGVALFILECAACGYEPQTDSPPAYCPRCHASCFARTVRPGSILGNSVRDSVEDPSDTLMPRGLYKDKKISEVPIAHLHHALLAWRKMQPRLRMDIEAHLAAVGGEDDEDSED